MRRSRRGRFSLCFLIISHILLLYGIRNTESQKGERSIAMDAREQKVISIGIEDFNEIIDKNGYLVDKTLMIRTC